METDNLDVAAWRTTERKRLLAARAELPLAQRREQDQRITEMLLEAFPLGQATIGFYWPMKAEFDPRVAIKRWRDLGARAALPAVVEKAAPLRFHEWWPDVETVPGVFNLPVPKGTAVVVPDAVLVPPVGFDAQGYRLGYGGGYFDRTLAELDPQPLKIAVAREVGRIDTIHPQWHDVPMDFIVSEHGVHQVTDEGLHLAHSPTEVKALATEMLERRRVRLRQALAGLLNTLLEAERAGAEVLRRFVDEMPLPAAAIAELRRIQRDEANNCAVLLDLVRGLGAEPSRKTGDFVEKALAVPDTRGRLEFLNRGQGWVARRISGHLPYVSDPATRAALQEMHDSHVANIAACEEILGAGSPVGSSAGREEGSR